MDPIPNETVEPLPPLADSPELLARLEQIDNSLDALRRQAILNLIMILGLAGVLAVVSVKVLHDA